MAGMGRIQRSWELGKTSWRVLRNDKDLAAFPVLGAIASIVCLYIGLAFVAVYFQAALTYGANERLQGRDTGIRASLDAANGKLHRLLPWGLVAATGSI